jgi:hypothetical protein
MRHAVVDAFGGFAVLDAVIDSAVAGLCCRATHRTTTKQAGTAERT